MAICKYQTKNGKKFKAVLWVNGKPMNSKSFSTKLEATNWLLKMNSLTDLEQERNLCNKEKLLDFFDKVYSVHHKLRPGTFIYYRRLFRLYLEPKFGSKNFKEITSVQWSEYFRELLESGHSKSNINHIHIVASAIYQLAFRLNYVEKNPLHSVQYYEKGIGRLEYWSKETCIQFLKASRNTSQFFGIYLMAYQTGMRISEILALKRDAVDLEKQLVWVHRSICRTSKQLIESTKTKQDRCIGLSEVLVEVLKKCVLQAKGDFIFCNDLGDYLDYNVVRRAFMSEQKKVGVKPLIGLHGLRHTFASHYVMNGGNIYDLQHLLGHASVETTMRYAHVSQAHLLEKVKLIEVRLE